MGTFGTRELSWYMCLKIELATKKEREMEKRQWDAQPPVQESATTHTTKVQYKKTKLTSIYVESARQHAYLPSRRHTHLVLGGKGHTWESIHPQTHKGQFMFTRGARILPVTNKSIISDKREIFRPRQQQVLHLQHSAIFMVSTDHYMD